MDLDTFLTTLYVLVDDWYRQQSPTWSPRGKGGKRKMSDSEVLTLAIACGWRSGVVWDSERAFVRYMQRYGLGLFPQMLQRSAFNERVRHLYGVLVALQAALSEQLDALEVLFECVDSLELPAFSSGHAQRQKSHWLWESSLGRGAHGHCIWGDFVLMSVNAQGVITGWPLSSASMNDHWGLEALLSARQGQPQLLAPPDRRVAGRRRPTPPPIGYIGGFHAVGKPSNRPYLTDKGFGGHRWVQHWQDHYHATVITVPQDQARSQPTWSPRAKRWLAHHRQIIETTFSVLERVFAIKRLQAHSRWGQLTRLAAKVVGYLFGIYLNRLLHRPDLAHQTLLC